MNDESVGCQVVASSQRRPSERNHNSDAVASLLAVKSGIFLLVHEPSCVPHDRFTICVLVGPVL